MDERLIKNQADLINKGMNELREYDPELAKILDDEVERQHRTLSLVASCCAVKPQTLAASASALVNVTAEGAPRKSIMQDAKMLIWLKL
ncbi:hypothetical protein CNEO_10010 [Clostridium neonatale]|uniref:Serine hydroxymethyltransferase-like domain-containing protein n=1 Tax=Clostridium neonatale TaxID=137838 RepID=A0AA86JC48_9CLOT|nr:hypothetical protein CNEO_10010 [Clostridium neonatale]